MLGPALDPLPNPGKVAWVAGEFPGSYAPDTNSRYSDPRFLDRNFVLSQEEAASYLPSYRPYYWEDLIGLPYAAVVKTSVRFGKRKEPVLQESKAVIPDALFCPKPRVRQYSYKPESWVTVTASVRANYNPSLVFCPKPKVRRVGFKPVCRGPASEVPVVRCLSGPKVRYCPRPKVRAIVFRPLCGLELSGELFSGYSRGLLGDLITTTNTELAGHRGDGQVRGEDVYTSAWTRRALQVGIAVGATAFLLSGINFYCRKSYN